MATKKKTTTTRDDKDFLAREIDRLKPANKSEFVRSLGEKTPAKDVVAAAKKRGIKLTIAYVYSIRSSAKRAARAAKTIGNDARKRMTLVTPAGEDTDALKVLRAAAAVIGLPRAIAELTADRAKVAKILGSP